MTFSFDDGASVTVVLFEDDEAAIARMISVVRMDGSDPSRVRAQAARGELPIRWRDEARNYWLHLSKTEIQR